ncbi:ATP-binding cassette domain-containing protein [Infirmifilum lucidum]|uniref:ATP-binding cassette domain-containing protein n=1 Tax=Infirmifilum lucidum TaxID=2776706 RepID=A0A7L9FHA9_9CREN|nr:ATP-binding cassette domain-containing protein [Infirmifilum lucidum]QOJ79097.1 ATP-binding cassette domain-containing protein [Infirmifilum lucidum]
MSLKAQEVSKSYNGVPVLRRVSVEAPRGRVTCIIGPNGSGKTTLLRIVAFLEKPDSGKMFLDGAELTPGSERIKSIAYLPQRPVALTASVYNNLYLPLRARGLSAAEASARARRYLGLLGLRGLEEKPAQKLSGGQRQLLGVARVLALEPEVLLLDEPTSHLDTANASRVRELVRDYVRERGAIAVVVSHSPQEVRELSDTTVLLVEGSVRRVYASPSEAEEAFKLFYTP